MEGSDEGAGEEDDGTFSEVETAHVKFEELFWVFFCPVQRAQKILSGSKVNG